MHGTQQVARKNIFVLQFKVAAQITVPVDIVPIFGPPFPMRSEGGEQITSMILLSDAGGPDPKANNVYCISYVLCSSLMISLADGLVFLSSQLDELHHVGMLNE